MKRILLLSTLAMAILAGTPAQALSDGIPVWTNLYNGPGNDFDAVNAMAVDSSGNVLVTGYVDNFDSSDFATIKYSSAGVPLWTKLYDGPENGFDEATAIAVDSSGNVLVTGNSWNGSTDFATIKYSSAGVPLWTNWFNGPENGDDRVKAVAVDSSGNVFVTGASHSGVYYASPSDYLTIKYSGAGVPLWTNRYNGPGNSGDFAVAVKVDGSNDVIVTGTSARNNVDVYNYDYATIKYSAAGVPLWTNRYSGPAITDDYAAALAVDGSNNVIVTGFLNNYAADYATVKYSGAGVPLWTNTYDGPANAFDRASAVAVDGSGNVFVTGSANGDYFGAGAVYATVKYSGAGVPSWTNRNDGGEAVAMAVDGGGNVIVTGTKGGDFATIKYSGAGVPSWTNYYNGPGDDIDTATAVAVDASGNVFVTGSAYGGFSYYDYATIKYSSAVAPSLTIARTATNTIAVSWPSPSAGFVLQQNTNGIATANWSNVLTMATDDGTNKTVIVNPATGNRFFRLKSQ